jgi:hypothetical protein
MTACVLLAGLRVAAAVHHAPLLLTTPAQVLHCCPMLHLAQEP